MGRWMTINVCQDGVGEVCEAKLWTSQILVQVDEHDGCLLRPFGQLRRESLAERTAIPDCGRDDRIGTIATRSDDRWTLTGGHRHDRHGAAQFGLEGAGQRLAEGAPFLTRRPALEDDDLTRPPLPAAHGAHGVTQPLAEKDRYPLEQRRMELEQPIDRFPR